MNNRNPTLPFSGHTLDLEILLCTHNRVRLLQRTLKHLQECHIPSGAQVGVFVVANACTDDTSKFLDKWLPQHPDLTFRWMTVPEPGKSNALNIAIPQARGRLLAFVDDDHRVDLHFIQALYEAEQQYPDNELFCGRILPDWTGNEPSWVHDQGRYRIYPLPVPRFDLGPDPKEITPEIAVPGGGNLAMRKALFEKTGPFRLDLGPSGHNLGGGEDIEWIRRALNKGARLRYLPEMIQYHYVDPKRLSLHYLMRKAFERSCSVTQLQPATGERIPLYMLRKTIGYLFHALASFDSNRRRFYLTRLAAAGGEIKGAYLRSRTCASEPPQDQA